MNKDERLYIAGPNCFWVRGGNILSAYREHSMFHGFYVALPGDPNKKKEEDGEPKKEWSEMTKRERGASILKNCADSMNDSTCIIANLDNYRGFSPDGGTIFEIGMAYAKDCKCYAYTRDKRPIGERYTGTKWTADDLIDERGRKIHNLELPFSVDIIGSCKLLEGNYYDALNMVMADIEEESKAKAKRGGQLTPLQNGRTLTSDRPIVYFCDFDRYDEGAAEKYAEVKRLLDKYGFDAIVPTDPAPGVEEIETDDPWARAYNEFDRYQQHVRNCDIILADLNDFYGYEPNSDVSFECGMAFQLDKKMYAFMDDIGRMIDRVPNKGEENSCHDINHMGVENFDAPVNLMFGSSYKFLDGSLEDIIRKMAEDLG